MEIKISEKALKAIAFVAITVAAVLIGAKCGSGSSSGELECGLTDSEAIEALNGWTII